MPMKSQISISIFKRLITCILMRERESRKININYYLSEKYWHKQCGAIKILTETQHACVLWLYFLMKSTCKHNWISFQFCFDCIHFQVSFKYILGSRHIQAPKKLNRLTTPQTFITKMKQNTDEGIWIDKICLNTVNIQKSWRWHTLSLFNEMDVDSDSYLTWLTNSLSNGISAKHSNRWLLTCRNRVIRLVFSF